MTIDQAFALALQHHQAGRLGDAEAICREILVVEPRHANALHILGMIAGQTGRHEVAVDLLRQVIALEPGSAAAHSNLGVALKEMGRLDEAIAECRQAIVLNPDYPQAHCNLGSALGENGQVEDAIAACRRALALRPNYPKAHCNLVAALRSLGQLDEAAAAIRQLIAFQPHLPEAYNYLGSILKDMGQLDDAIGAYRQAVALKPDFSEAHGNLVYTIHFHPGFEARAIAEELRCWNRQHAEPLRKFIPAHDNDRTPGRRLRIGYVSPDFREHCQSLFTIPLLSHHDHHHFEIICYASVSRSDRVTLRIRGLVDAWRNTVGLSDEQLATKIREDQIDILVDLTMHMGRNRGLLFARKPAPLQVTWLAYPGSTGLTTIDYRLTDPFLDPPGMDVSIYAEKTVHLPHTFWCYDPLDGRDLSVNALPALADGFVTFGCLNNFCKVNDSVLRLWASVLRAVPSSRLLLLAPAGSCRRSTIELLGQEGIDSERIEFVSHQPRREYLELYHRIDLGLDTLPYNGHTTSLDSFWMGVPVVTLVGQTIVGRAGLSQLMNLHLPELIATTPDQYVRMVAELAGDLPRLSELRRTLRSRMEASPLMDAPRFARDIEAAYREMWTTWCAQAG